MRYGHELGERRSTKDSMVGAVEVSDHEVDVVGVEVVWGPKLHRQRDLPERCRALSGENTPELCLVQLEISRGYLQSWQTVLEQYINGATAINQHSVKLDPIDTRIKDQRKMS